MLRLRPPGGHSDGGSFSWVFVCTRGPGLGLSHDLVCRPLSSTSHQVRIGAGGCHPGVGGDDDRLELDRQLYVESIDPTDVVTESPRSGEQRDEKVATERRSCCELEAFLDLGLGERLSPIQPSQRRQNLGIEVRGYMNSPLAIRAPIEGANGDLTR